MSIDDNKGFVGQALISDQYKPKPSPAGTGLGNFESCPVSAESCPVHLHSPVVLDSSPHPPVEE